MNKELLKSPRTYLLIGATLLLLLIIVWPIYFFAAAGYKLININLAELTGFLLFELALVVVLVIFWELYRKFFKELNN
jgi:hypothetical protein